jgi:G3E family GTPase
VQPRPSRHRSGIPVAVVAGFLGAGKTTLLNHVLRNRQGRRIGVLVNDFGKVGIDALAVAGQVDALVKLGNGCLCCAVDVAGLDAMLARLTRPAERLDGIVIEASGLAEPREMVRQVLSSANPRITYGGLVEVVDAEHFEELRAGHPHVDGHLAAADLVVLTKADRVDDGRLDRVRALAGSLAGGRPVVVAPHGRIDPALLFDAAGGQDFGAGARRPVGEQLALADLLVPDADAGHLHDGYAAVDVELDEPLHPAQFLAFLEGRPPGLYRVKGLVTFAAPGRPRRFWLQAVGDHLAFSRPPAGAGGCPGTRLVFVGTGLDEDVVRDAVRRCVVTGPLSGADGALGRVLVLAGAARR